MIYEVLGYNTNHLEKSPCCIIKSESFELCDHIFQTLGVFFAVNRYNSFKLVLKCVDNGQIIKNGEKK
jgi:hypothetical protein